MHWPILCCFPVPDYFLSGHCDQFTVEQYLFYIPYCFADTYLLQPEVQEKQCHMHSLNLHTDGTGVQPHLNVYSLLPLLLTYGPTSGFQLTIRSIHLTLSSPIICLITSFDHLVPIITIHQPLSPHIYLDSMISYP